MTHHPNGPSSLGRRSRCPGSCREELDLAPIENEDAAEGTECHRITAGAISLAESDFDVLRIDTRDEEHIELVKRCIRFVQSHCFGWTELHTEKRIPLYNREGEGTADVVVLYGMGRLDVIDWKFGRKELDEAEITLQLTDYCVDAMREYECDTARGLAYQPRTGAEYTLEVTDRRDAERVIDVILERTYRPDAPLRAGEWCTRCKALGICAATQEMAVKVIETPPVDAAAVAGLTQKAQKEAIKAQLAPVPVEKIRPFLEVVGIVEAACAAVRARARECLAQDPDCIEGWELKETRGSRTAEPMELYRVAVEAGLPPEEFLKTVTVSVPSVEKAIIERWKYVDGEGSRITKKEREAQFASITADVVTQPTIRKLQRRRK